MKTARTRKSWFSLLILTAALTMLMMIPSYAAEKRKLVKSYEMTDANGKLSAIVTYTYDSKGNRKKATYKDYENGKLVETSSTNYKTTYWSGSSQAKKIVETTKGYKSTTEYTKSGLPKRWIRETGTDTITTDYTIKGGHLKKAVTKDSSGKVTSEEGFDSKGNTTYYISYDSKGKKSKSTYKMTYKNGVLRKQVVTGSDKSSAVYESDKHGNLIKTVLKTADGQTYSFTVKIKYSGDYVKVRKTYDSDGKLDTTTTYQYTSKAY